MFPFLLMILAVFFNLSSFAEEKVLNIFNWSGYMPNEVLRKFSKETGIKIHYNTYDSNETLYSKLKANPVVNYDIIIPSTYFVSRMIKEGMLQKLNKSKLTNLRNLDPALMNKSYDLGNQYSLPYAWSSTGIAINTHYHPLMKVHSWRDFWSSSYRKQLLILNDMREVFSVALMVLGYSPNDTQVEHIKDAYEKLRQLFPNVKVFNSEGVKSLYLDEDLTLGMAWSGDIYQVQKENPNVYFIYPKEGYILSIDSVSIPSKALHPNNAHAFINFILKPEISAQISLAIGYASPNKAARRYLPKEVLENRTLYPDSKILERGIIQTDVGDSQFLYERYWELLKIDE